MNVNGHCPSCQMPLLVKNMERIIESADADLFVCGGCGEVLVLHAGLYQRATPDEITGQPESTRRLIDCLQRSVRQGMN